MNINKLQFSWKPVDVKLGTISENACIGDCYQCIKKCTICLKFQAMPPDYLALLHQGREKVMGTRSSIRHFSTMAPQGLFLPFLLYLPVTKRAAQILLCRPLKYKADFEAKMFRDLSPSVLNFFSE